MSLAVHAAHAAHLPRDVAFIVERYHRAFDDELAQLRVLAGRARAGFEDVTPALDLVAEQVAKHTAFQEGRVFPTLAAGWPCSRSLFEGWTVDALRLCGTLDGVRHAQRLLDHRQPLAARVAHFANEVQEHLVAEATLLAAWTRGGRP
jgi:hypothetical protein